jgi:hypothetical protein
MGRRTTRRKISSNPAVYPRSLSVLEPGRTRRHPVPLVARALWGVATAVGLAMALAGLIAWLG